MDIGQLVLLAIVQGLTEFLPVSSSGHLALVPFVFGTADQGPLLDLAVHFGSLFAVLIYFWKDCFWLLGGLRDLITFKTSLARTILIYLIIASLPVLVVGAVLLLTDSTDNLRDPWVIAFANLIFAGVLYWTDKVGQTGQTVERSTFGQAMIIGASQILALIPGTSRSGITMSAARLLNFSRIEAARYAMLLAIPTILAGGAGAFVKAADDASTTSMFDMGIAAGLSFLTALLSIWVMMELLKKISFLPFVIYRVILGLVLIAILLAQ